MTATFRIATEADLPAIVRLLADDDLGRGRERFADPLPQPYVDGFRAMQRQGGNDFIVAEAEGRVIGCLQLTIIYGVSRMGATRAQIEAVRVDRGQRGRKLGEGLIQHAIERAKAEGCTLVQLTTDKTRADAHRFYERLGFKATHEGMKRTL